VKNRAWGGRFKNIQKGEFLEFSASIDFDKKLALLDIRQNIVQSMALQKAGIISKTELAKIEKGLREIENEVLTGKFKFRIEDEDVHMNIERRLREKVGGLAGKVHTGRSRNDQVSTDLRLYTMEKGREIISLLKRLQKRLVLQAEKHIDYIMPAYTHLQMAQPVRVAHWFLAYVEMFSRDQERFMEGVARTDSMPLGSGALAGNNFGLDRKFQARLLGFTKISNNSIDAVSDRDFALDFCYASSVLFMHISRLSEELVIFSSSEFNTVSLPDEICTGSSIMPQKKNPDLPELLRGKAGRVTGNLLNLLMTLKGLPLAYNRDLQEDKPALFDSSEQVLSGLPLVIEMVGMIKFNKNVLESRIDKGFMTAVDMADYLVMKGVPFRDAHHVVGEIVGYCESRGISFMELSLADLKKYSKFFGKDIFSFINPRLSPDRKKGIGTTAKKEILRQIKRLKGHLG